MPTNDFLPFGVSAGANVSTQAEYLSLAARANGFSAGTAVSKQLNKAWRQSSVMAAAVGQFIADNAVADALDDGNVPVLVSRLAAAVRAVSVAGVPYATSLEITTGMAVNKVVNPAGLKLYFDTYVGASSEANAGVIRKATSPEALAGASDTGAITPAKNKAVLDDRGFWTTSKVTTDLDAELTTGVYSASGPAIVPDGGLFQVFNTRSGGDARWQSQLLMGIASSRILYRSKGNYAGALSPLVEFYSTGNCYLVGASVGFYRDTAPPGFLKENGAAVSRTTYAALFAAIGTKFGAGDGVTTFNLPDSRALFSRALDDSKGIDVGRQMGSTQAQSIQSHNHVILTKATNFSFSAPGGGNAPGASTTGATEAAGGAETRPANIAKLYCIKF